MRRAYGQTFAIDELEDIYSSAWIGTLRALESRQHELDDEDVRRYLLTAVANQASKEIRRRRRKPVAPLEAAGEVPEGAPSPEETAASHEAGAVAKDVLSSLPPRRRAVMLLRYGWGLDPAEVCSAVKGLSARAYRKEITRGVDEVTARMKLVEEGRWCEEREPLLKSYAAGLAGPEEIRQAEMHLGHCRSCSEFVGKLTGHLHDLGGALLLPGALDGADRHFSLGDRARDGLEFLRETSVNVFSREEAGDAVAAANGLRGAGVGSAGIVAKLSVLGSGTKAAMACIGGGAAATACVAAGVAPLSVSGAPENAKRIEKPKIERVVRIEVDAEPPATAGDDPGGTQPEAPPPVAETPTAAPEPSPTEEQVLAPDTPPVTRELGVESAATPTGDGSAPQTASTSGDEAVATEFGP